MAERLKALYKLSPVEKCPGEYICTTDTMRGPIARGAGRTLENFCNPTDCRLFHTKTGAIPQRFLALVDAAARLREKQLAGYALSARDEFWWQTEAYLAQERARRLVENEDADKPEESLEQQTRGDSGAFKFAQPQLPAASVHDSN